MVKEVIYDFYGHLHNIEIMSRKIGEVFGTETVDLNVPRNQELFKRVNANLAEEVSELYETIEHKLPRENTLDEVSDVIGFLISLRILVGLPSISPQELLMYANTCDVEQRLIYSQFFHWDTDTNSYKSSYNKVNSVEYIFKPVYKMFMVCNLLKNRPWKQSNHMLDKKVFIRKFEESFYCYLLMIINLGFSGKELLDSYTKKYDKNILRIKSNY